VWCTARLAYSPDLLTLALPCPGAIAGLWHPELGEASKTANGQGLPLFTTPQDVPMYSAFAAQHEGQFDEMVAVLRKRRLETVVAHRRMAKMYYKYKKRFEARQARDVAKNKGKKSRAKTLAELSEQPLLPSPRSTSFVRSEAEFQVRSRSAVESALCAVECAVLCCGVCCAWRPCSHVWPYPCVSRSWQRCRPATST
jgi:hypothetical protein